MIFGKPAYLVFGVLVLTAAIQCQSFDTQWISAIAGPNDESVGEVTVNANGDVTMSGTFRGTMDFDPGPGTAVFASATTNAIVARYASDGQLLWASALRGPSIVSPGKMVAHPNGNVIIAGGFRDAVDLDPGPSSVQVIGSAMYTSTYFTALDASGNYVWGGGFVGTDSVTPTDICVDGSGNVIIVGTFWGSADFDPGPGAFTMMSPQFGTRRPFAVKLDSAGNFIWARDFDAVLGLPQVAADPQSDEIVIVENTRDPFDVDPGAGVVLVTPQAGTYDIIIIRMSSAGAYLWSRQLSNATSSTVDACEIGPGGEIHVAGSFSGLLDLDPGPATLTVSPTSGSYLVSLDNAGNLIFGRSISALTPNSLALTPTGNVVYVGAANLPLDLDPGAGVQMVTPAGSFDIWFLELDAAGVFVHGGLLGGSGSDLGPSIAVDTSGNTYVAGVFSTTADFDPGPGAWTRTSAAARDMFLARLGAPGLAVTQAGGPGSAVTISNSNLRPLSEYYNVFSLEPCGGTGPYAGLCASTPAAVQFLVDQISLPLVTPIFHFRALAFDWTWAPLSVPPITVEGTCIRVNGGLIEAMAPAVAFTVR